MNTSVSLRAMEPEDLDVLYRIENDRELWDAGVTNVPYSRFLLHEYISRSTGDIYADGQVRLMIENGDNEVVGIVDVVNFDARNRKAELGIVIMSRYRRRGYGSATIHAVADYSQRVLHLHQLYAFVDQTNVASLKMFEKAGYEKTAEIPDWLFDGHSYRSAVLVQLML